MPWESWRSQVLATAGFAAFLRPDALPSCGSPTTPTPAWSGLGAEVLQAALGGDAEEDLLAVLEEPDGAPGAQAEAGLGAEGAAEVGDLGDAQAGQGLGEAAEDAVGARRRAGRPTTARAARSSPRPPRRRRARARTRPAASVPSSTSSRPIALAASRVAALTSARAASAAATPSGWTAARLRASATTKQPSTSAQVISPEVGAWPRLEHVAQVEQVVQRQELVELQLGRVQLGDPVQAVVLDRPDRRLAVLAREEQDRPGPATRVNDRFGLRLEVGQRLGAGVGLGDRRDHGRRRRSGGSRGSRGRWRTCRASPGPSCRARPGPRPPGCGGSGRRSRRRPRRPRRARPGPGPARRARRARRPAGGRAGCRRRPRPARPRRRAAGAPATVSGRWRLEQLVDVVRR